MFLFRSPRPFAMDFPIANYVQSIWSIHFWVSLAIVVVIRIVVGLWWTRRSLPPGPIPYPIVGNIATFRGDTSVHEVLLDLSQTHGTVMTIFVGGKPHVVLSEYELAKEMLTKPSFACRPDSEAIRSLFGNGHQNIVMGNYGPLWQLNKRAAAKCMRSIPDGLTEERWIQAVDGSIAEMLDRGEVDPEGHTKRLVLNGINSFAFGKTYQIDDPEFERLADLYERAYEESRSLLSFDYLPFAEYWPMTLFPNVRRAKGLFEKAKSVVEWQICEHRRSCEKAEERRRDFCDALLEEQESLEHEDDLQLTDHNMVLILIDLFSAGIAPTASALNWFILFMATHTIVQDECHGVIEEVLGDRPPKVSDFELMPIVEACIMETLRLRPPMPIGVVHTTTERVQIGDYSIPEGTAVIANIYAMHLNPNRWPDSSVFDPRMHFLDDCGKMKATADLSFAPFGFGPRNCLGESLARTQLFLAVTRLLQTVRIEAIDGESYHFDQNPEQFVIMKPSPYKVRFVSKHDQ